MLELAAAALLVLSGLLTMAAGIGVWRLPGTLMRMHAAAKGGSAAFGLVLAALLCRLPDAGVALKSATALLFTALTLPLAAQLLGRYAVDAREDADLQKDA